MHVSYIFAAAIAGVNFAVVFCGRNFLVTLFTHDADVHRLARKVVSFVAANQLADCFSMLHTGVLRGQGGQRLGLYLNLLAYYAVAVPLALFLPFCADLGLVGLMLGLTFGVVVLASAELMAIVNSDSKYILRVAEVRHNP